MAGFPKALVTGASFALAAAALALGSHDHVSAQPPVLSQQHRSGLLPTAAEATVVKAGLFNWLFGDAPERRSEPGPRLERNPQLRGDDRPDDDERGERRERYQGTFRTLCVRLCDGFYFPISAATSRESFASDARRCEQSCPARSRLFVYRNAGEGVESMVDLKGRPYRDLPTAFQHLTRYDASCTCNGNPWDEAALARHRAYAQQEAERKAAGQVAQSAPAAQQQPPAARQGSWGYRNRQSRREWNDRD